MQKPRFSMPKPTSTSEKRGRRRLNGLQPRKNRGRRRFGRSVFGKSEVNVAAGNVDLGQSVGFQATFVSQDVPDKDFTTAALRRSARQPATDELCRVRSRRRFPASSLGIEPLQIGQNRVGPGYAAFGGLLDAGVKRHVGHENVRPDRVSRIGKPFAQFVDAVEQFVMLI
jgi:hypothetical protein